MKITPEMVASFRKHFKGEFSDKSKWDDEVIFEALEAAIFETGGSGWGQYSEEEGNFKRLGMFLYAANYLASFYGRSSSNGINGEARLNIAGKSVGDESIQYRVAAIQSAGNDFLTYTIYGQQFVRYRKIAGSGARAV